MKFSWKWLNELIDINHIPIKEITQTLTLAGFEVEEIEYKPSIQDISIDISTTSNRADISSMIGLAREISTLFNIPLKQSLCENIDTSKVQTNNIPFTSQVLLDLRINIIELKQQSLSPIWLKNHLAGCGRQPVNVLSDISEYIKLKWGQDIEILNLRPNKIQIPNKDYISLEQINSSTQVNNILHDLLVLNTGKSHHNHFPPIEAIKYNYETISILGITSNQDFFCDQYSTSILIIGQLCKPEYIENIITKIHSKTEKISKQLKGISRYDFKEAYQDMIHLISSLHEDYIISNRYTYTYHDEYKTHRMLNITKETINNILGPCKYLKNQELSNNIIHNVFKQLKFQPVQKNNTFFITIPEYRQADLRRNIDVVEEIVRIYGFDKFLDKIPVHKKLGYTSKTSHLINKLRHILRYLGLHEVIHYSLDYGSSEKNKINIYNPLLEEQSELKTSLIQQLIKKNRYNANQKNLPLECFEIGKVFKLNDNQKKNIGYTEEIYLAGILGNYNFSRKQWSEKNQELTWFQCKGLLEELFEKLHAEIDWIHICKGINYKKDSSYIDIYHPYRTAILCNSKTGQKIGIFGQINSKNQKCSNIQYNQYIFEINIAHLMAAISDKYKIHLNYNANKYSIYPSVIRDISLKINNNQNVENVKNNILNQNNSLIESVEIFNEYKKIDNSINDRYVGFRITYRSSEKTLNHQDIQQIDNDIKNLLNRSL